MRELVVATESGRTATLQRCRRRGRFGGGGRRDRARRHKYSLNGAASGDRLRSSLYFSNPYRLNPILGSRDGRRRWSDRFRYVTHLVYRCSLVDCRWNGRRTYFIFCLDDRDRGGRNCRRDVTHLVSCRGLVDCCWNGRGAHLLFCLDDGDRGRRNCHRDVANLVRGRCDFLSRSQS